jgi:hypothetical protein
MKNLRRWPRLLLGIIYLLLVYKLLLIIRDEYIITNTTSVSNNVNGGLVLGLSLITDKPQTLLSSLNTNENNWSTSFLSQSQNPTVQVFLDYISIYENADQKQYCFNSLHLGKNINVPYQVVLEIQESQKHNNAENSDTILEKTNLENNQLGILKVNEEQPDEYIFRFNNLFCLDKGKKYFVPHLFLGIISSEMHADLPLPRFLGFPTITGHRALEFFPFEKQKIVFDLDAYYVSENKTYAIRPNLDVSISQQGWVGEFESVGETIILSLSRPAFYKIILIAFTLIIGVLILFLNNIIDEAGGFFEIAFGLLLGLWGTHEILIPEYIGSSIPIDVVIYILYALVIGEIIAVFIDEALYIIAKRTIKIVYIENKNIDEEHIVIENHGWLPVDMTGWVVSDQATNKFKFPVFVLPGKISIPMGQYKSVKIWTKAPPERAESRHFKENLYWGRRKEVWDNDRDIAYLEDSKGEAIDTYSYPKRRREYHK